MIIGIDVDGVLADFAHGYEQKIIEVTGRNLFQPGDSDHPPCWDWDKLRGYTGEEIGAVWKSIRASRDFWYSLGALPGVEDFIYDWSNTDHEIYFITDRPGVNAQIQTQQWLIDYDFSCPSVIISRKGKGAVCAALSIEYYIDDKLENIEDVAATSKGTHLFMPRTLYNQDRPCPGTVIESLGEFHDVIR